MTPTNDYQPEPFQESMLLHYWSVLQKRRFTALFFLVVCVFTVMVVTLNATPYYSASAMLEISPRAPMVMDVSEVSEIVSARNTTEMRAYYVTQYRILQSRTLLEEAVRRLREQHGVTDFDNKKNPIGWLREHLTIAPEVDSLLVRISFEHPDPIKAALFANTIADTYMAFNLDRSMEASEEALSFLEQQQELFKIKRQTSEEKVHSFKFENDLAGLDQEQNAQAENLVRLRTDWSKARSERIEIQAVFEELKRLNQQDDWRILANHLAKDNENITGMLARFDELQQKRSGLVTQYKDKWPEVVRIDAEMTSLEAQIRKQVSAVVATYGAELSLLTRREAVLQAEMETAKSEVEVLERKLIEYGLLQDEAERNEKFFKNLDTRMSEVDLSQVIRANNIRVVDRALPSEKPVRPKVLTNLLMSLLIGVMGACALALFAEFIDATVKSREDVENIIGAPFLGVVPLVGIEQLRAAETPRDRSIVVFSNPRSAVAETLRTIRASIFLKLANRPVRRFLVTSAAPQEGKSFLSGNLASIMAMAGSKVLLVDADLRRPSLHKIFDLPNEIGLSHVLVGTMTPEQAIQPSHVPDLDLLLSGPLMDNPAELLEGGRIQEVIGGLGRYDVVIIDSPPVNAVTDPLLLSSMVDGVIIVVETGRTRRAQVIDARRRLADMKANILGVIVNKLNIRKSGHGYHYYDYNHYSYYYAAEPELDNPKA